MKSLLFSIREIVEAIAFLLSERNIQIRSGVLTTKRSRKAKKYIKFVWNPKLLGFDIVDVFPEDGDYNYLGFNGL